MGKFTALQKVDPTKVTPQTPFFDIPGKWQLRLKSIKHLPRTKKGKSLVFTEYSVIEGPPNAKKQYTYCYDITGADDTNPAPQECAKLICLLAQEDDVDKVMSDESLAYIFSDEQPFAGMDIVATTSRTATGYMKLVAEKLL
jgi:hypothetical protein